MIKNANVDRMYSLFDVVRSRMSERASEWTSECNQFGDVWNDDYIPWRYRIDPTLNKCVRRSMHILSCSYDIRLFVCVCFIVLWLAVKYTQIYNHKLNKRNNLADFVFFLSCSPVRNKEVSPNYTFALSFYSLCVLILYVILLLFVSVCECIKCSFYKPKSKRKSNRKCSMSMYM